MMAAVCDFAMWNPGETVECVLCGGRRGGADPPGPWTRHHGDARRRVPILGPRPEAALGYLEYQRE